MEAEPSVRVVLDATLDRASVIHGTLTVSGGRMRDFHGWLELTAAIEAVLKPGHSDPQTCEAPLGTAHGGAAEAIRFKGDQDES